MKNRTLLLLILFLSSNCFSQTVTTEWVNQYGGQSTDYGNSICADRFGNIYTTGYYNGTADFDPGLDSLIITSNGNTDIFITKSDPQGQLIWAKGIGGNGSDEGRSITTDSLGNVYITGIFQTTADFASTPNSYLLTSAGASDVFILKLDQNGNFIWAKNIGGTSVDYGNSICVDSLGNVLVTGSFDNVVDFDPGTNINNLTSTTTRDGFILKLDNNGLFVWAKQLSGIVYSKSITIDQSNNILTTGYFSNTDFDPSPAVFYLNTPGGSDAFILKLDNNGNFIWAKSISGASYQQAHSIVVDNQNNLIITGFFKGITDFDVGVDTFNLFCSAQHPNTFIEKLDSSGNFIWAKQLQTSGLENNESYSSSVDSYGNIYTTGYFRGTIDLNPDANAIFNLNSFTYSYDSFILKLDSSGAFQWGYQLKETIADTWSHSIITAPNGRVYCSGGFMATTNFGNQFNQPSLTSNGSHDIFLLKLEQKGVSGSIFNDLNSNCQKDSIELFLSNRRIIVNPGNIVSQTNNNGLWFIDSLPSGVYTVTVDTSGNWMPTCSATQSFSVVNPDSITLVQSIGLISTLPCSNPDISIDMPAIHPCFTNQKVYIQACNQYIATGNLDSVFVTVDLDSMLTPTSSNIPYTDLGNNQLHFYIGTLYPGECYSFWINTSVSCNALLGQSLCIEANLYPAESCVFDTIPTPYSGNGVSPCTTSWDNSNLQVDGSCQNDSIYFSVTNTGSTGTGDMSCYAPVRLYIDGQLIFADSILLLGGESQIFAYSGDGRIWRFEADQHPLHPGNSHPNATVELCGNVSNWSTGFYNVFPMDNADPITDIYCGTVTSSFDPNDKTGFPIGLTTHKYISPNKQLEYQIRFQNTGTDTAFTVVIKDTLDDNLNIFSVQPEVASHPYYFRMYGPRVLEWTFYNILLPDSTTDEQGSHGFVTFKVNQQPNLSHGTQIRNDADIYFDFNAPVITNKTLHTINDSLYFTPSVQNVSIKDTVCNELIYNGLSYTQSGTYWQYVNNPVGDSLVNIELNIKKSSEYIFSQTQCNSYTLNGQTYDSSNTYSQTLVNTVGCDSIITLDLTILNSTSNSIIETACSSYTSPSGIVYTSGGTYFDTIPNGIGCDSTITIDLTILPISTNSITETACNIYTSPSGQVYVSSGNYTDILQSANGCDSIISINLTINTVDTSITQTGIELTANNAGATYQWISCDSNSVIAGATNQNFSPTENGWYAVMLSENGCLDTSFCYQINSVGLIENSFDTDIVMYPNPTNGLIHIDLGESFDFVTINIIDLNGKIIFTKQFINQNRLNLNLTSLANGIYLTELKTSDKKAIWRIVKEK